ncbi:hypothetical protein PHYPO_G00127770 [Pangasianodon hypophthalmus]|uniref:C1q domain-containing protein n=1 Tax=Pangasianodon hypophthalmus TaxID=310915 RepID=A0A5N5KS31_PANHP|nr:hypothetical protein PHYPO_G00127770 [Pangasianodon hypophthalmus]
MSAMLVELKVEQRHPTTAVNNSEIRLRASESQVEELIRTNGAESKVNKALAANQSNGGKIKKSGSLKQNNSNTGIFTVPAKGVYHFRFSIHGAAPHPITVALNKNNDHMTGTYAHQSQNNQCWKASLQITGEDTPELHSVDLELEAVEKQIRDLQRQGTTEPGCSSSGRHEPGPGRGPLPLHRHPFEISTRNRFAPLRESECDTVIIGDSIVRHVRATTAKGKVRTRCFPCARVLDVTAQVPAILNRKNIGAVVLHAGTNDTRLRQTEILKKDFRSLIEKVRSTSPTTRIIVSGPLPMFQRGIEESSF